MLVAKYTDANNRPVFAEVVKVGSVLFDARPGWILLAQPLDVKEHKRTRFWVPPGFRFEWIRTFGEKE